VISFQTSSFTLWKRTIANWADCLGRSGTKIDVISQRWRRFALRTWEFLRLWRPEETNFPAWPLGKSRKPSLLLKGANNVRLQGQKWSFCSSRTAPLLCALPLRVTIQNEWVTVTASGQEGKKLFHMNRNAYSMIILIEHKSTRA
jgi:hypothetical protein